MPRFSEDEPLVYAIRLTMEARLELDEEHNRLAELTNLQRADEWRNGLLEAIRTLATLPDRCVIAPEDELFKAVVRQLLYRRKRGPIWRILFSVYEANDNDPPIIRVHHIRHGAQASMTEWPADENE